LGDAFPITLHISIYGIQPGFGGFAAHFFPVRDLPAASFKQGEIFQHVTSMAFEIDAVIRKGKLYGEFWNKLPWGQA
jgi:hypothetical protein